MKIAGYAGKDEITLEGKKINIQSLLEDQKKKSLVERSRVHFTAAYRKGFFKRYLNVI